MEGARGGGGYVENLFQSMFKGVMRILKGAIKIFTLYISESNSKCMHMELVYNVTLSKVAKKMVSMEKIHHVINYNCLRRKQA